MDDAEVVDGTPTVVLETTLDLLMALATATGGAVWYVSGRDAELIRAKNVGQRALTRGLIAREFDQLRTGTITMPDYAILPVRLRGGHTAAFYLEEPRSLAAYKSKIERLLAHVGSCLDGHEETADTVRTTTVERKQALLDLCEREEWCLARIARRLGVSRPTLYRRLQSYGLARPDSRQHPSVQE